MDLELADSLLGQKRLCWESFLRRAGLAVDALPEKTVLLWDGNTLIATGSRQKNLLKYVAVDPMRQGEGLTASVLTALRQDAFACGYDHLFLYTKPQNKWMFQELFFHPVAQTDQVLLMEDRPNGIGAFLSSLPAPEAHGTIGAAVMNCNPFTLGHRYLIETAAGQCDRLYVFVLSQEQPPFPARDRLELVRRGVADLTNVTVLPTGPYLLSAATFPTYFLPDRDKAPTVQCGLDVEIFARFYAPHFGITRRFLGTEPMSAMTHAYNSALKAQLPERGIEVTELPRLEIGGEPVSASRVRALLGKGQPEALHSLLPPSTFDYLQQRNLI